MKFGKFYAYTYSTVRTKTNISVTVRFRKRKQGDVYAEWLRAKQVVVCSAA